MTVCCWERTEVIHRGHCMHTVLSPSAPLLDDCLKTERKRHRVKLSSIIPTEKNDALHFLLPGGLEK